MKSDKQVDKTENHVVQVAVGSKHALLLTDEGIVYSWGTANDYGYLGRSAADEMSMQAPTPITETFRESPGKLEVIVQIACGLQHCLALSKEGKLYSWGYNKAGQLGLEGYAVSKLQKQTVPTPVCHFEGKQTSKVARSCACGPESSACVTIGGDIYVWGACSFYMFGEGRTYAKGENCTIPVKIRSNPVLLQNGINQGGTAWLPDRISVWKNSLACTIANQNVNDDLLSLIDIRKQRANVLAVASRHRQKEAKTKGPGDDVDTDDLRRLNFEYKEKRIQMIHDIKEKEEKLKQNNEELKRVTRELTICDQQDTAYNESASSLEVRRSDMQGKQQHAHVIDSQLNDINQFKASNRRNKVEYLAQRDRLEQQNWRLNQELNAANQSKIQADARTKLIRALAKGDVGKGGSATVDDGLRIAASKREELAATYPQTLSGVGKFNGFREVLSISDRALQDVSSALKEVSAAATGGDGQVLEEVLESNLKLRKEYNMNITEKIGKVMGTNDRPGLISEYFNEQKLGPQPEEGSLAALGMSLGLGR